MNEITKRLIARKNFGAVQFDDDFRIVETHNLPEFFKSGVQPLPGTDFLEVFPEFIGASYMKRYELFCRKLVLERHYTSAAFITSRNDSGLDGVYNEPANDIGMAKFATALTANIGAFT